MPRSTARTGHRRQEAQRFVFVDLDGLLSSVQTHVVAHETIFHKQLAQFSTDMALDCDKLTVLLNDQHPAKIDCWRGTYCANPNLPEAKALEQVRSVQGQPVTWKLTQKGTPEHPTLEKMLKRHLKTVGDCNADGKTTKTLVLATGALQKGMRSCVEAFLQAHWRVQLVCLENCWKQATSWHEFDSNPGFQIKLLDGYLTRLLTGSHAAPATAPNPRTLEHSYSNTSITSNGTGPANASYSTYTNGASYNNSSANKARSEHSYSSSGSPTRTVTSEPEQPPLPPDYYQLEAQDRRAQMLEQEMTDIQRRRARLGSFPTGKYAVSNRQRFVYMNLDNIAGAVCNSQGLYQHIEGARNGFDVRLNFRALTERVCQGGGSATVSDELVKRKLASYRKMPRELALPLQEFDWEITPLSQSTSGNKGLYYVLLDLLKTGGSAKFKNTLVLVMGDGALGGSGMDQKEATRDLLTQFLDNNWFLEVHSWLHAVNDWFLDLQERFPYRVIVKPLDDAIQELMYLKCHEEEVWVEPVWHDPAAYHREVSNAPPEIPPEPAPPAPSAWGSSPITLFPSAPLWTPEQRVEQRMMLENERMLLLDRLRRNQEALDALDENTWAMQSRQNEELSRLAQQASDKQLALRMAEEEANLDRLWDDDEEEDALWGWT